MTQVENYVGSSEEAAMMKEAISKLTSRVEALEKSALSNGGVSTNDDGTQDFRPMLVMTLARMKEIHAALVTRFSAVDDQLNKLKAAEETIAKQAYQIKHLKRSLEAEERKNQ